jgi:AcrR family transcriptional regulator
MPSDTKEKQILAAAEALFTSKRFHEVTMDDIATAAHVGKGTIYRYFADKDALFQRIAVAGYEQLAEMIQDTAGDNTPFEDQLQQVLAAIANVMMRKHQLFRLIHTEASRMTSFRGAMRSGILQRRKLLIKGLTSLFQRGIDDGKMRGDIPPEIIASTLLGMTRGFLWHSRDDHKDPPPLDDLMSIFLNGVAQDRTSGDEV